MPALKLGIQLSSLRLPLKQGLQTAAKLGAGAVEIDARGELRPRDFSDTARRQLKKMLDDLNLRVCAVGFRTRRGYDVMDDLDRRIAATKEALTFAHALGASVVVNHVGRVPEDEASDQWSTLVAALSDIGRHADRAGAMLAAQTGSESGADLARLVAAMPPGSLLVDLDPGNLLVNGFTPLDAVSALGSNIAHVHATDAVRDLAQGRGLETPLGRGSVDYLAILAALDERGYRGYFTIARRQSENPVEEIAAAVQYLRSV